MKVIQKHEETTCETSRTGDLPQTCDKQVPCLKAIQKGPFTQNRVVLLPTVVIKTRILKITEVYIIYRTLQLKSNVRTYFWKIKAGSVLQRLCLPYLFFSASVASPHPST